MTHLVLRCAGCGARVPRVRDTRFGLAPSGSLCVACTSPAWARSALRATALARTV